MLMTISIDFGLFLVSGLKEGENRHSRHQEEYLCWHRFYFDQTGCYGISFSLCVMSVMYFVFFSPSVALWQERVCVFFFKRIPYWTERVGKRQCVGTCGRMYGKVMALCPTVFKRWLTDDALVWLAGKNADLHSRLQIPHLDQPQRGNRVHASCSSLFFFFIHPPSHPFSVALFIIPVAGKVKPLPADFERECKPRLSFAHYPYRNLSKHWKSVPRLEKKKKRGECL